MAWGSDQEQPVRGVKGLTTEYAAAFVVIGALVLLILIRRGWRGASVGGASLKIG
jgi:hypothetical protein